ncbi:unnamed protein product, partial [Discosporangium mesarthrocarpum]
VLCSQDEVEVLSGAGDRLISEAALLGVVGAVGSKGAGTGVAAGGPGARAGANTGEGESSAVGLEEDDGVVLRAFRSGALQSLLNVTSLRDSLLPDLIGRTLPQEWREEGASSSSSSSSSSIGRGSAGIKVTTAATAFPWTPGVAGAGHPGLEWFRRLWGYLALRQPGAVRLLAESHALLPTGEGEVCPLSLRAAVVEAGCLPEGVRACLVRAGCRTLLPGLFAGAIHQEGGGALAPGSGGGGGVNMVMGAGVG